MDTLLVLLAWEGAGLVLAFVAVVFILLLNGEINTHNLLCGLKKDGSHYFSPERVQLLIFTLAAAFQYVAEVVHQPHGNRLPEIPQTWVALLGASNTVYLAGKAYSLLWSKISNKGSPNDSA